MNIFWISCFVILWAVVLFLGFLLLGTLRSLGVLSWRLEQLEATTPKRLGRDGLKPGKKAPDFTLPSANGKEISLHDFAGRKVLLVFTQSGCSPCKAIIPELNRLGPALAVGSHPATLELASRIVEIAKLPVEEQFPQLEEPGLFDEKNYPLLAGLYLVPRVRKESSDLHEGQASSQAELRRALAAIASERYRRVHGSWPVSLAALVPDYLPRVPADPYDGGPFRFQRLDNSLVIDYVTNSGFRLWDAPQRRQPAHARE